MLTLDKEGSESKEIKERMSNWRNKENVTDRKSVAEIVNTDRVSIKTVKHGAPESDALSLGSWIGTVASPGQAGSSSVTLPSYPIISTNVALSVTVWSQSFINY